MKIGFLTQQFPHPRTGSSGGIGTAIKNLSQALIAQGHEVSVLIYEQNEDAFFEDEGICFYKIKNEKRRLFSGYFTRKKIEKLINTMHRQKKLDIVEAPDWTGISSFIKPDCPLIIRENGSDSYFCYLDKRPVKWKNRFHERRALLKADGIISVSEFTGQVTNEVLKLNKPFTVIPNSVDTNFFKPKQQTDTANQIVLYFGNLIRKKGALELPGIFNNVYAANPSAQLYIVGNDIFDIVTKNPSTWSLMEPLFSELAFRNVRYFGSVDYEEIRSYISHATVCIFPSFAEALPLSWLEAMAMGKAVVTSDIGWAAEMIEDGKNGYMVAPSNHKLFAERVNELLRDISKRQNFGNMAAQTVKSGFSSEIVTQRNIEFYKKIINDKK